jgi:PIN domain nuclease of toxin-antitoxin system
MADLPRVLVRVRVLLDAHVFLWSADHVELLPPPVYDLVSDTRTRLVVSVATTWELTIKALAGKLTLPKPPHEHFTEHVERFGCELLPVHQRHVAALQELPAIHADPFDRMLVAQALVEDLDLVTGDEVLQSYPIRTIW